MDKQREMFEKRFHNLYLDTRLDEEGDVVYIDDLTQGAWLGWQAAQKAQWQQTTTLPPRYEEVIVYPPPSEFCSTAQYGQLVDGSCDGWYYSEYEFGYGVVFYECHPTHWMPLPPEPAE